MRIQRSADHRVVPWDNGLGVTADVFCWPAGSTDWTWRLSIADVSDDLPFSFMPGVDRHIVVAQGKGMALTIDGGPEHRMDCGTLPLFFAGESATSCRLLDGPIAALNLMLRRGRVTGGLRVISVPPGAAINPSPGDVAIVVLDGSVTGVAAGAGGPANAANPANAASAASAANAATLTTSDAVLLHEDSPAPTARTQLAAAASAGPGGARVAVATVHEHQ